MNVFNFVLIIYESRSTSFSMKRRNHPNCFEFKTKQKKGMCRCVIILFFVSQISNKAKKMKKKKLFTLFSALRHQRTAFICSNCVYLVKKQAIRVYILFINVNIYVLFGTMCKNCLRILRYCLCLRMIVAFYFSERDESIIINIVCTVYTYPLQTLWYP